MQRVQSVDLPNLNGSYEGCRCSLLERTIGSGEVAAKVLAPFLTDELKHYLNAKTKGRAK